MLKALIADDQHKEVLEAEKELKRFDAAVDMETTFQVAWGKAQSQSYDIAVIDLGWRTDDKTDWTSEPFSDFDKAKAGFRLAEQVRKTNPIALIIIYSLHVDEFHKAIVSNRYLSLKKQFNKQSRTMLIGMVSALSQRLPLEKYLVEEVKKAKSTNRRLPFNPKFIFMIVSLGLIIPILGATLVYSVSNDPYYSIGALVLSLTTVLIGLVASRLLTMKEANVFLDSIYSLAVKKPSPNNGMHADAGQAVLTNKK